MKVKSETGNSPTAGSRTARAATSCWRWNDVSFQGFRPCYRISTGKSKPVISTLNVEEAYFSPKSRHDLAHNSYPPGIAEDRGDRRSAFHSFFPLVFILSTWLLIDSISGFLLHNNIKLIGNSLGAWYRIFVFTYLLIYLRYKSLHFFILLFLFLSIAVFHAISFPESTFVQTTYLFNLQKTTKVIFPILLYLAVRQAILKGALTATKIKSIILLNSLVLFINLFLFFLGIGFTSYGVTQEGQMLGSKGFLFAGNEVSGTLLALLICFLIIYAYSLSFYQILFLLSFFVASIVLFTKSAFIGFFIILCSYLFFNIKKFYLSLSLPLIAVMFVGLYKLFENIIDLMLNRWWYFIGVQGAGTYLLGGSKRITSIASFLDNLAQSPERIFYGVGWKGYCENNFFDLFQAYGIWGLIISGVWIYWLLTYIALSLHNKEPHFKFLSVALFLLIGISYFAGHIMQSAMLAPFIALIVNSDLIIKKNLRL